MSSKYPKTGSDILETSCKLHDVLKEFVVNYFRSNGRDMDHNPLDDFPDEDDYIEDEDIDGLCNRILVNLTKRSKA